MELEHSFIIPVPPEQAWPVLLDVERIAPCMPGATIDSVDGDVIKGRIKVKVGPVQMTYAGTAHFTERDDQARSITLEASGKETRGAGTASATVRSSLEDEGGQTKVVVHTSMNVTGRPAQFGRGVMVEVGGKLVEKFAENLAQMITGDAAAAEDDGGDSGGGAAAGQPSAAADAGPGSTQPSVIIPVAHTASPPPAQAQQSDDSINLVRLVGPAILKRVVPVAAAVAVLVLVSRRLHLFRRAGRDQEA